NEYGLVSNISRYNTVCVYDTIPPFFGEMFSYLPDSNILSNHGCIPSIGSSTTINLCRYCAW
ncbi:MAG: hypothetical protein PUC90_05230, partial [Prevotella sp.]|nr:hypothetical protein [Prevotella sp.]